MVRRKKKILKNSKKICGIKKKQYLCNPVRRAGAAKGPEGVSRAKGKIIEKTGTSTSKYREKKNESVNSFRN